MKILKPILIFAAIIAVIIVVFNIVLSSMGYSSWFDVIDTLPFSRGFTKIIEVLTGIKYTSNAILKSSFFVDLLKFILIVIMGAALDGLIEIAFNSFGNPMYRSLSIIISKFGVKIIGISIVIMYTSNLISGINNSLFNFLENGFWGLLFRYLIMIFSTILVLVLLFLLIKCLYKIDKNRIITSKLFLLIVKSLVKVFVLIILFVLACMMFSNSDLIVTGSIIFIMIIGIMLLFDSIIQ